MVKKRYIAYLLFLMALCYIISPWFFEKKLLFNELIAFSGLFLLAYKKFKIGNDNITRWVLFLVIWGSFHTLISLFRMDKLYYYLRNLVIVYSMFSFFIGYYLYIYLKGFISKIFALLKIYIVTFLFLPVSTFLFERFGMATLFPALFKKSSNRLIIPLLIPVNIIYAITYNSATAILLSAFYFLILFAPGYRFFKQIMIVGFIVFAIFFISIQSNLNIIANHYTPYSDKAIHEVMDSHPLLSADGNTTWRLVLWKQIIVDHFPDNIAGLGFGTPVMKYYPVEDYSKLDSLPYVLGAHNSFIYLFGRLGIFYLFFLLVIYTKIFKEYFYHKRYYYSNKSILIFLSFFAITIIALFNPTLESPIFASAYWLILGFLSKVIYTRESVKAVTIL